MEFARIFLSCTREVLSCENVEKDRKLTSDAETSYLEVFRCQMLVHPFKESVHLCQRAPSRTSCTLAPSSKDLQKSPKLFSADLGSASKPHFLHRVYTPTLKTMGANSYLKSKSSLCSANNKLFPVV